LLKVEAFKLAAIFVINSVVVKATISKAKDEAKARTKDALFVLFCYPNSWSVYSNTIRYSFPSVNRIIDSTASESLSPWCALPARAGC